jgi:hypothetical protein
LSNHQALMFYKAHKPSFMHCLVLSHLSKKNNCPDLVNQLFSQHADGAEVVVASRYRETAVYTICCKKQPEVVSKTLIVSNRPQQLSLF